MSSASGDSSNSRSVLDPFTRLITQIGIELTSFDVKVLKTLTVKIIPRDILNKINVNEQYSALDLFEKLQEYRLISENNLSWLKEALITAKRVDLATKVEKFEKTVIELKDAPPSQMNALPAPKFIFLRLLLGDLKRAQQLTQQSNLLRESICTKLDLELKDVAFIEKEDSSLRDCVFLVFQFPNAEPKIMQLNCDALDKATWLVDHGVLQLQIGDKASINIRDNLQDVRPIAKRQTSFLAVNSSFAVHQEAALDVILCLELPSSVSEGMRNQLLLQCQSAVNLIKQLRIPVENECFNMRLGLVTHGNHAESTETTAFIQQRLSNAFNTVKNGAQCIGGDGCSGMADALKRVVELSEKDVSNVASKVCILFTFLNQKSCDPEHYRCSHGNDVIKLCYTLAKHGITLYVIGLNKTQSVPEDNHFLSGVAALGGGIYLEVNHLNTLDQVITRVIQHDVSIENQGQVTCKSLIDEINRKYGIVNVNHLARNLKQTLNEAAIGIDGLRQNGENLAIISQISQRVAIADDLEDAIIAIQTMKERLTASRGSEDVSQAVRSCGVQTQPYKDLQDDEKKALLVCSKSQNDSLVDTLSEKDGDGLSLVEKESIDLEVAARMVRRQIHRLEYQKVNNEQNCRVDTNK